MRNALNLMKDDMRAGATEGAMAQYLVKTQNVMMRVTLLTKFLRAVLGESV